MNVLLLSAGPRPSESPESDYPLCLLEFDGVPLIDHIARKIESLAAERTVFAASRSDVESFHLDEVARQLFRNAVVIKTQLQTGGSACTALLAIEHIDNDAELLIVSANELVDIDLDQVLRHFRTSGWDAGTVTFSSIHPRYSYVRLNGAGLVVEAAQRKPISRHATVGVFWFARGADFVSAAQSMIRKGAHVAGAYYICPVFNEMILRQAAIGTYAIDGKLYHPLKSERQINHFEHILDVR